jgi:hypothetical protein
MKNMLTRIISTSGVFDKTVSWVLYVAAIWIGYIFMQVSIDLYIAA